MHSQNSFENKIFCWRMIKNDLFELILFLCKLLEKTKGAWNKLLFFFRLPNMSRSFLSLVIHHLTIFSALIQRGFWVIAKIMIGNLFNQNFYEKFLKNSDWRQCKLGLWLFVQLVFWFLKSINILQTWKIWVNFLNSLLYFFIKSWVYLCG